MRLCTFKAGINLLRVNLDLANVMVFGNLLRQSAKNRQGLEMDSCISRADTIIILYLKTTLERLKILLMASSDVTG